jgi:hypothetical protein
VRKFEIQIENFSSPSPALLPLLPTDPPENVTITPEEVQVVEGSTPSRLLCSTSAYPSKFHYPIARFISVNLITTDNIFLFHLSRSLRCVFAPKSK